MNDKKKTVLKILIKFSLAAPTGAIVPFFLLAGGFVNADLAQEYLGLCLLFSAGSFLYVATVHVLPEVQAGPEGKLNLPQMGALVGGIVLPMFITIEHDHAHGGGR